MLEAIFTPALSVVTVTGLFQWDYGQSLSIKGLALPTVVQVHFSAQHNKKATVRMARQEGSEWVVPIPDELLTYPSDIRAWIYEVSDNSGETLKTILLPVTLREQPESFIDPPDPDDTRVITEFITVINQKVAKMEQLLADSIKSNSTFQSNMAVAFQKYYEDLKLESMKKTTSAFDVTLLTTGWSNNTYTIDISSAGWSAKSRIQPNFEASEANLLLAQAISGWSSTNGKTFTFTSYFKPAGNIQVSLAYFGEQN